MVIKWKKLELRIEFDKKFLYLTKSSKQIEYSNRYVPGRGKN